MPFQEYLDRIFHGKHTQAELQRRLEEIRQRAPVPVFWLFGKTQTGKTSVLKFLTGAVDVEIGQGFKPTTRFSLLYHFPTAEAPLMTFLDTRGLNEPGYDSAEDIARFQELAHLVIVTARVMDHSQERVIEHLRRIRAAAPSRPVLLLLTCLHEAYPQQQHPLPYPFGTPAEEESVSPDLRRSIEAQKRRFVNLYDAVVPIDLTPAAEGFNDPHYGGAQLKSALVHLLPAAYRQTLLRVDEATRELRDWHESRAMPYILSYSMLAAAAGAFPVPFVDLLIVPGVQTRMIYHLAKLYGQPLTGERFLELAGTLGLGMLVRQAVRGVAKLVPGLGSALASAAAASSTFALGKAFCYYYSAILAGHVPRAEELKKFYRDQLIQAEQWWKKPADANAGSDGTSYARSPAASQQTLRQAGTPE